MFCKVCGCEMPDDANVCPRCGSAVENSEFVATEQPAAPAAKFSVKAIVGFAVSLVGIIISAIPCGIVGIIFSILGMKEINTGEKRGKGFAIAGLVVSILDIVFGVINVIIMMIGMSMLL